MASVRNLNSSQCHNFTVGLAELQLSILTGGFAACVQQRFVYESSDTWDVDDRDPFGLKLVHVRKSLRGLN